MAAKPAWLDDGDVAASLPTKGPSPSLPASPRNWVALAWSILKWTCLVLGLTFAVYALQGNAIQASARAAVGCFLAITARICQAEEHRERK